MRQFRRTVPFRSQLPHRFCWSAMTTRGIADAGPRPPRLDPLRQPLGRATAEPGHEVGPDVRSLLRAPRRGNVEPAAAQLRLSGYARMHLQAVVTPEIQDALPADELPRRRRCPSTSARRCLCSIAAGVIEGACGTWSATGWSSLVHAGATQHPCFIHARVRIRRVANLVGAEAVLKLQVLRSQPRLRCVLALPRRGSTSSTTPNDTLME